VNYELPEYLASKVISRKSQRHGFITVFEYMGPCRCDSTVHPDSRKIGRWPGALYLMIADLNV
jgi:hypothetical protein